MKKLLTIHILLCTVLFVSCKKEKPTNDNSEPPIVVVDSTLLPQLQTLYMRNISDTAAECVCNMINWDSVALAEWGCCWSTTHNPTINDNHVQSTIIMGGQFVGFLTDLTPGATYYVRAYGQNSEGIGYGNEIEFVAINEIINPEPIDGHVPSSVLPDELLDEISQYMNIYSGEDPSAFETQFVSSPHKLMHTTLDEPADTVYYDRYFAFLRNGDQFEIYGKVWDDFTQMYVLEAHRLSYIVGSGNNFTAYYVDEGYPNGHYARQATIFSGTFDESTNAVNDFKMAVILVRTYGNPNLPPENSYRIIGDEDGVAEYYQWLDIK